MGDPHPHSHPQRIVPVLAGGGTRLPAHVGVLAALHELGIRYDHIVGVSGGGLSTGRRFEQWMDHEFGGLRFSDLDMDLSVVACNVRSGQPVVFDRSRTPVMCFRIRDKRLANAHPARRVLPVADCLFMLVRTLMSTVSREYLSESLWLSTVLIETEGMSPLEFNMSPAQKLALYELGYATTRSILPDRQARAAPVPAAAA